MRMCHGLLLIVFSFVKVTANYSALLDQVTGIRELESVLASVEANIGELNSSLKRYGDQARGVRV